MEEEMGTSRRLEFIVKRYNPNPSAIDFVCFKVELRKYFPAPKLPFKLIIDSDEYLTSIQEVKDGRIIIGKTFDSVSKRVIRHDLCNRHNIREGDRLLVGVLIPFQVYCLSKI